MTQYSAGVLKASEQIVDGTTGGYNLETIARIIDRRTHASEMQAFIEKIKEMEVKDFTIRIGLVVYDINSALTDIQAEAFTLIKKVGD